MESKVSSGASTANNLIAWANKFSLPQPIIDVFLTNGMNTLEDVGRTWASNYKMLGNLLKDEAKTRELKERLQAALEEAENFFHQMEKKRIFNDEDSDYEKVDAKQVSQTDLTAVSKSKSEPLQKEGIDLEKLKIGNNGSRENSRESKIESTPAPTSLSRQSSISVDENAGFLPDFQDWITKSAIPGEITDEFLKNNILSLETLATASDKLLNECGEKVKPIPRKKFLNAVKELRIQFGMAVAPAPAAPSPAPAAVQSIPAVPVQYQDPMVAQMTAPPIAPAPEADSEDVIMGEIILMSTESTKSIEELRKQLEHENNTIETLIQLTVNSKEKFTDKALEIINQSKLDHQERAKRIKKLIQAKRAAETDAGIAGNQPGPNKINNLVRSTSTTSEPGVPVISSGDSSKKLAFTVAVNTHLIAKDSHWKDSKKYPSVERLKPKDEVVYEKPAIDPGAVTVRRADGIAAPAPSTKPQADPSKPSWTCSICKRVNGMELNKCPDCFSDRYGKSSVGEKYHARYDGYGYIASTSSAHTTSSAVSAAAPPVASSHVAPHPKSKPDVYGGGYNLCKKCRRLTDKRFFCLNCVAEHERKIGHPFDGECSNCRDCGEITMNEDYCDDCGLIRTQAKKTPKATTTSTTTPQYYNVLGGAKPKIKHCGYCHKQMPGNVSYCPHCLNYQP